MRNTIWLSYDLGVQGDYHGLYQWLDEHEAKECGDTLASLVYEHVGDLLGELTKDIKEAVQLTKNARIYVIYRGERDLMKGKFIVGARKAAPWSGFAQRPEPEDSEEAR